MVEQPRPSPELIIEQKLLKLFTEIALRKYFGRGEGNTFLNTAGKLSMYPERVDKRISASDLLGHCCDYSIELQRCLLMLGIRSGIALSESTAAVGYHFYLQVSGREEMLIDPTIGQFLDGHNHVFVGERDELKQLVLDGRYKLLQRNSKEAAPVFFERIWGERSATYEVYSRIDNERIRALYAPTAPF